MRQILDLFFRRKPPTSSIIDQQTNHSGNASEKARKIQETSPKRIVDTILEELESNSGEPVNLLKLGDALLDMSKAISEG
jgi:prolyl-tRNA editing enzyme YbaK/EbsC (Cys-tRNA(Pro) deacylase)